MRAAMIFKFGLTVVVFVAIYMFYAINQQKSSNEKESDNDQDLVEDSKISVTSAANDKEAVLKERLEREKEIKRKRWKESIHLSVVACGDRGDETIVLLKSAVLLTTSYFIVHIFAERELQDKMKLQLDFWPVEMKSRMEYHIYNITFPGTKNTEEWKKLFKPCASQRIFLPSILTEVDSLIYVDTDILFMRPLDDLWSHFEKFNSTQLAALSPEHEDSATGWYNRFARHPYYGELGVNSGVMLMNLTRLRNTTWIQSITEFYKEYKLKITWGDQDLINIYFHFHPDQLYIMHCGWNYRPDHCMYMSVCKPGELEGASVLHGNRRVMHNDKQPAFKVVYEAFRDHLFSSSLQHHLLVSIKRNIQRVSDTNCGKLVPIFTKQIDIHSKIIEQSHSNSHKNENR